MYVNNTKIVHFNIKIILIFILIYVIDQKKKKKKKKKKKNNINEKYILLFGKSLQY